MVFGGVQYATRGEMCAARRRRYVEHLEAGMDPRPAARAVGVSKRTGKVYAADGRTRSRTAGTRNRRWTGIVPPWTFPKRSVRGTKRQVSASPTGGRPGMSVRGMAPLRSVPRRPPAASWCATRIPQPACTSRARPPADRARTAQTRGRERSGTIHLSRPFARIAGAWSARPPRGACAPISG